MAEVRKVHFSPTETKVIEMLYQPKTSVFTRSVQAVRTAFVRLQYRGRRRRAANDVRQLSDYLRRDIGYRG